MNAKQQWAINAYNEFGKDGKTDYHGCHYLIGWLAGFDFAKSLITDAEQELGNGPFPYQEYMEYMEYMDD